MNYVVAVLGIFVIFLIGLWLAKRKAYQGPKFALILGEALPETASDDDNVVGAFVQHRQAGHGEGMVSDEKVGGVETSTSSK